MFDYKTGVQQPLSYVKPECLGCRTFFTLNEQLAPSTPSYFDLVELPLKNPKQRVDILRFICSFLSSKGGHLFLGVDRKTWQVRGNTILNK